MSFYKNKKVHKKITKSDALTIHAKKRGEERFGLELTGKDLARMVKQIQEGTAQFVKKTSNRVSVFMVLHDEKELKVVYCNQRKRIVTILPD